MTVVFARLAAVSAAALVVALATAGPAPADNVTADHDEDGKWLTDEDVPTFKVEENGSVDWYTFSGYRRYHADCHIAMGRTARARATPRPSPRPPLTWTTTTSSTW